MYTILKKQAWNPRPSKKLKLEEIPHEEIYALDIETSGLNPKLDRIIGVAIAGEFGSVYIDTRVPHLLKETLGWLRDKKWVAFNSVFDGSFIVEAQQRLFGGEYMDYTPAIVGDTLISFKLLANEGRPDQRHNLGVAIDTLLGWEGNQKNVLDELLEKHSLTKGEMGKLAELEPEAFAEYGAMDAEACYQLMMLFGGYEEAWPGYAMMYPYYVTQVQLTIEQKLRGEYIDVAKIHEFKAKVDARVEWLDEQIRSHPHAKKVIEERDGETTRTHYAPVVSTKTIWAKLQDEPWNHPEEWTQGERTKKAKWEEERGSWYKKVTTVRPSTKKSKPKLFSLTGDNDIRHLLYGTEYVKYKWIRHPEPEAEKPWERRGIVGFEWEGEVIDWETTPGGGLPITMELISMFGDLGKWLAEYSMRQMQYVFINNILNLVSEDQPILYPDVKVAGTKTGRGSGGKEDAQSIGKQKKLNIQQLPKVGEYLDAFRARPGHKLTQLDFNAVEDVIMAELSGDPTFMEIYGSGKHHCGYLYFAIQEDPQGPEIAKVYHPENPTEESVGKAKKQFKKVRGCWKVQKLMSNYSAGADKKRRKLMCQGIFIDKEEGVRYHKAYKEATKGIDAWQEKMENELVINGGYILNGLGRPQCIPLSTDRNKDRRKDCKSRVCQSTGHDMLVIYTANMDKLRRERKVKMYPWSVNTHDETTWESPEAYADPAAQIHKDALDALNFILGGKIPIKGGVEVVDRMTEYKLDPEDRYDNRLG